MKVTDLNREQLIQLKQRMYMDRQWPSWSGLAEVDGLISDEEVFEEFDGTDFVEEDFTL